MNTESFWSAVGLHLEKQAAFAIPMSDPEGRRAEQSAYETRAGIPWKLLYSESFETRDEAVSRELYFKTGRGREELDRLCEG